jgi:CBS domain-containing protein
MSAEEKAGKLEIHVLRTPSSEGAMHSESMVFCPRRGETVTVVACATCGAGSGIVVDDDGRAYVRCDAHNPTSARATAPRRLPLERTRPVPQPTPADAVRVGEVMTRDVLCVHEELPAVRATQLLLEANVGGAPVIDAHGRPIGMISKTDLLRAEGRSRVTDLMTPLVFSVDEAATLSQASALMAFEGVHRLPVVSPDGHVVGILSALDVLRWLGRTDGYLPRS